METAEDPYSSPSATGGNSETHQGASQKRKHSRLSEAPAREYGVMRDSGQHDTSRFVGSASGIHFIRSVYQRLSRNSTARGDAGRGVDHLVPGEDDQINLGQTPQNSESPRIWDATEVESDTVGDEQVPPFEQMIEWSQSYFELWHPTSPFLNAKEVLDLFDKISAGGVASLSHLERSMVRSVFSISLADRRQSLPFSKPLPRSLVFHNIEEAISASHFTLYQPASLHATQAALSIQLFLISMLRLNAASRLGGLIVRMSFHLGLHRCPSRYPFFTPEEASMRRRVFWSMYCNERFLSQSLGLPLDIKDDDVDVCYPGEEKHSDKPQSDDSRLKLLTYLSRHARVRGLILELRNKAASSKDRIPFSESYVRAEMGRWTNEIQDALEDGDDDIQDNPDDDAAPRLSPGHRLYLSMLQFEAQISLNRPMMAGGPSSDSWSAGLQYCISAARGILSTLRKYQAQQQTSGGDNFRLKCPIIWPTVTWAIWISSFILIYAASERQVPVTSALRHIEAGERTLLHIASRKTAWPHYCLSAIDAMTAALREIPTAKKQRTNSHPDVRYNEDLQQSERSRNAPRTGYQVREAPPSGYSNEVYTNISTSTDFSPTLATSVGRPEEDAQAMPEASHGQEGSIPMLRSRAHMRLESNDGVPSRSLQFSDTLGDATHQQRRSLNGGAPGRWPQASPAPQVRPQHFGQYAQPGDATFSSQDQEIPIREGEESMIWYEQLFANSLGALDYPYMAAAQFDASVDPTWSYLQ